MIFKTKKAARAAGFQTAKEWLRAEGGSGCSYTSPVVPRKGAEPIPVKGEAFFAREDCEELVSPKEAKRRGLLVPDEAQPVEYHYPYRPAYHMDHPLFRLSDCVVEPPPQEIDLLSAIYTVNKSAKRVRDAASRFHSFGRFVSASFASRRKKHLYSLKDRGIMRAHRNGGLEFVGTHGPLAVYRGQGYCFHSYLVPAEHASAISVGEDTNVIFIEASPRGSREARLKDAEFTLQNLSEGEEGFVRLSVPAYPPPCHHGQGTYLGGEADEDDLGAEWRDDLDYEEGY